MENRTQLAVALTKASITGDGEQMLFAERRERSLFTTRGPVASPTGDAPRDHDVEHVEHVDDAEDVGGPFGT
jgi:hypothetical protein